MSKPAFIGKLVRKAQSFRAQPLPNKLNLLHWALGRVKGTLYYRRVFGSFGSGSVLFKPMLLNNPQYMHIGKNVLIRPGARLEAIVLDPQKPPELRIGDNVNIEQDVHIVVMGKVHIASNVSITARCSLLCGNHPFLDVHDPIKIGNRLAGTNSVIEIGEGSFLGIGTVIAANARIGKHVVVGSNSVVKRNVPDYSVVDGNPAAMVMKYDFATENWVNLKSK